MSSYELKNEIVRHYAGSISYGTNLPTSDVDVRGIFCASPEEIRTPFHPVREVTLPDHEDGKLYELSTFMELYTKGNPNILETLWVDDKDIISTSPAYDILTAHRAALLSSKVAFTFSGYAISQLKRIKGHNKWLNSPQPKDKPQHKQFLKMVQNFSTQKIMPRDFKLEAWASNGLVHYGSDVYGIVHDGGAAVLNTSGDFNISVKQLENRDEDHRQQPIIIFRYLADEYRKSKENHKQYWTWKENRNEVRGTLEEDFGYDTKHAMHLVRLLRMGEEILSGQGVIVKRPDAEELLAIRAGAWSYEQLLDYAQKKDTYICGELYNNTSLRKKPDLKLATKVLIECQNLLWSEK